MKTIGLNLVIALAMFTSVFGYSQDWQPKLIQYDNKEGVFISVPLMDSISVKLINHKTLYGKYKLGEELVGTMEKKYVFSLDAVNIWQENSNKWQLLYEKSEKQNRLHERNEIISKEALKSMKIRGNKKALYFFGGGVTVGVVVFAVLIN